MKKKLLLLFVVLLVAAVVCGCTQPHEHAFDQSWSTNPTHHWHNATCEHDVVANLGEHDFDGGVENETTIVYTCKTCQYENTVTKPVHTCTFEGDWLTDKASTILEEGIEYRNCTDENCILVETRTVQRVAVASIAVTNLPTKLLYHVGESFDSTGIVVTATGVDGSTADVTELVVFDKTTLTSTDGIVVVSYAEQNAEIQIQIVTSVSEARLGEEYADTILLEGYFVGIADEGYGLTKEFLLKDINSDDVIAVQGFTDNYGTFPNVGYQYGDLVRLYGKLVKEVYQAGVSNTQNKILFEFDQEKNPQDINQTIVSQNNKINYKFDQVVELEDWYEWKQLFDPTTIQAYTYIKITGKVYLNTYVANDGVAIIRVTANGAGTNLEGIKPDGKRALGFRQNVIEANLGENWRDYFCYPEDCPSKNFPGYEKQVEITAIVTCTNSVNYQLTVLCADWVTASEPTPFEYTSQQVVYEVAHAFHRQGNQAKYNQKNNRREPNSSPEDATEQDVLVLDCSSYANTVYYEAFGENILTNGASPSTANYDSYAKNNVGKAADVVGYWENKDYTTEEEQQALLDQIRANLQVGDCVVYRHGKTSGTSGHVMVYMGNNYFLHSTGTDYSHASDPTQSYDKKTSGEVQEGTVQYLSADAVFTPKSSTPKRYLFYKTESDSTFSFCVLRPIARGLVPTAESEKRMSIQGLDMEKSVSVGAYNTIYNNDVVTYTVRLENTSNVDLTGVNFKEDLPQYCTFVNSQDGVSLSSGKIVWMGDIAKNSTVNVSYTVKVSANESQAAVVSGGKVNGVGLNTIYNTISYTTAEQMQQIATIARNYGTDGSNFENPIDFVKTVYSQALGVTLFDYTTVNGTLTDILDSTSYQKRTDTEVSQMVASYLYGGLDVISGWQKDVARVRLVEKANMAVGDVIVAEKGSMSMTAIYLGDGMLAVIYSTTDVCQIVDASNETYYKSGSYYVLDTVLAQLISYDRFAVIRPSTVVK